MTGRVRFSDGTVAKSSSASTWKSTKGIVTGMGIGAYKVHGDDDEGDDNAEGDDNDEGDDNADGDDDRDDEGEELEGDLDEEEDLEEDDD